jgi:starch synthase
MRVLFATAEAFPLAKTGGLADVSASLPAALSQMGVDVRLIMPAYPQALARAGHVREAAKLGTFDASGPVRLLETTLPGRNVPVWLVDCPDLYNRTGSLYQDEHGADWADNDLRFALLNHAAAAVARDAPTGWSPDLVHANDWHCGLLPLLLNRRGGAKPATLFTIHNLAYQGQFDSGRFAGLGVPGDAFSDLEFWGHICFLKAGIIAADAITTVSPNYAREILSPEYGCGLDGLLRHRSATVTGILNGADYGLWDPSTDPWLARNYSPGAMAGKSTCKHALRDEFGLEQSGAPLLVFMSRLVHQKMPDVLLEALPALLDRGMQFAAGADGEARYRHGFEALAARYPGQVAVHIGYDEGLAHRLIAGADMLLHPSRYEPCGLVPIYAMRYGAIPIVRRSGGLADTVTDYTPEALASGEATGFMFESVTVAELTACAMRASELHRQPISWRKLRANAMRRDFGWRKSAAAYLNLYRSLAAPASANPTPEDALRQAIA